MSTRRRSRPFVSLLCAVALAATPLLAPVASAQIVINPNRSYPSASCPKANGLQACIDGLDNGAGIRLTEVALDEDVLIRKSMTLVSSESIRARLHHIRLEDTSGRPDIVVTLKGLEVTDVVDSSFTNGSLDHVTISDLRIGAPGTGPGVVMSSDVPIAVDVERSTIRGTIVIGSTLTSGRSTLRAAANTVRPGPTTPVFLTTQLSAGTIMVDIHNNVIRGAQTALESISHSGATLHADLVGNTVDDVDGVVGPSPTVPMSGTITLDVFDNIFTNVNGTAFAVPSDTTTFRAGHNDYFRVDRVFPPGSSLSAGSGNQRKDPKYVDRGAGDLRLKASSPLIDKGRACTSGGLEALDAAGRFRWAGSDVDMGAFERGAGAPTGVVRVGSSASQSMVGTAGRDVLCGLGGNDTLTGRGGPDYLDGGAGKDTLCVRDGVRGNDIARGGSGRDRGRLDARDRRSSIERTGGC